MSEQFGASMAFLLAVFVASLIGAAFSSAYLAAAISASFLTLGMYLSREWQVENWGVDLVDIPGAAFLMSWKGAIVGLVIASLMSATSLWFGMRDSDYFSAAAAGAPLAVWSNGLFVTSKLKSRGLIP